MVRTLLVRGMLVGIVAGLLCFAFLKLYGEPQLEQAIAFETQLDESKAASHKGTDMSHRDMSKDSHRDMSQHHHEEPELIVRGARESTDAAEEQERGPHRYRRLRLPERAPAQPPPLGI